MRNRMTWSWFQRCLVQSSRMGISFSEYFVNKLLIKLGILLVTRNDGMRWNEGPFEPLQSQKRGS